MKILIIGPAWVGDMVMAQCLLICLKRQFQGCEIDVLAPPWSQDLLACMPQVERFFLMPIGHGELALGKRAAIARAMRQNAYQRAIVLPNSFKSALIPWLAKIPVRTGWRGEARTWLLNDCRSLNKGDYPLMAERFTALAYPAGQPLPKPLPQPALVVDEEAAAGLCQRFALNRESPALALCPGAEFGESKKWPAAYYAEVAGYWLAQGGQVWLLGSGNDKPDAAAILQGLNPEQRRRCVDFTGRTSLGEAAGLLSLAAKVITNDSGLMHVAAALDKPLVVLYGSTSPEFTPPLTSKARVLRLGLDCSPCFKRTCPLQHGNCLGQLKPELAIEELRKLS